MIWGIIPHSSTQDPLGILYLGALLSKAGPRIKDLMQRCVNNILCRKSVLNAIGTASPKSLSTRIDYLWLITPSDAENLFKPQPINPKPPNP